MPYATVGVNELMASLIDNDQIFFRGHLPSGPSASGTSGPSISSSNSTGQYVFDQVIKIFDVSPVEFLSSKFVVNKIKM